MPEREIRRNVCGNWQLEWFRNPDGNWWLSAYSLHGMNSYTAMRYPDGRIGWDFPERVPRYVLAYVRRNWHQFTY